MSQTHILLTVLAFAFLQQGCGEADKKHEGSGAEDGTESSVASETFSKTLSLQGITFELNADGEQLIIAPKGLEINNRADTIPYQGTVVGAEIEDLNSDGSPEVMTYLVGDDGYGQLIAYSVNKGKSMSQVAMPDLRYDEEAGAGYRGGDEFAVIETSLARRFMVYDENGQPTGKVRQLQYKLFEGEAMRQFRIVSSTEFDAPE